MIGALLSVSLLAAFFTLCFLAFKSSGGLDLIKSIRLPQWVAIAIIIAAIVVFVGYMESQDRCIYYWDKMMSWQQSIHTAQLLFHHPLQALREIIESINNNEYNMLIPSLIAVPLKLFGYSHSAYVCLNAAIWLAPTLIVQMCICVRIMRLYDVPNVRILAVAAVLLAALFPAYYYALLWSFFDIAVLLPVSVSLLMLLEWEPSVWDRSTLRNAILLSFILMLIALSRRHFAFYVVGFGCAMIFKMIYSIVRTRQKQATLNAIRYFAVVVLLALLVLLILFPQFIIRSAFSDYATAYSGYNWGIIPSLTLLFSYFGLGIVLFLGISLVGMIQNKRMREPWIALAIITTTVPILFFRIQHMGVQHALNIVVPVFLLCFSAVAFLGKTAESQLNRPKKILAVLGIVILLLMQVATFAYAFMSHDNASLSFLNKLNVRQYTPEVRYDLAELNELATFVDAQEADDGEKTVYVLASGNVLNESILRNINFPDADGIQGLQQPFEVDLRDGFPTGFLNADFVIVTDPINLHLAEGAQENIRYLAQELLNPDSEVGKHYEEIASFPLDKGYTALVYKKISEYSEEDLKVIRDYYSGLYPDQKALFEDRIVLD